MKASLSRAGQMLAQLREAWDVDGPVVDPEKKGMFQGKTLAELRLEYNQLKKSGPHERGSKGFTRMKQLLFAIRAKQRGGKKWGSLDS